MTTHLPQLEGHLIAAASTRAAASPVRRLLGRPAALGAIGAFVVASVAGAVALSAGSVDPAITARLSVLRAERTVFDDVGPLGDRMQALERQAAAARAADPGAARAAHGEDSAGGETLNYAASRRVRSSVPALKLWLVARADDQAACLVIQPDGASIGQVGPCITRAQADVGSAPQTFSFEGHTDLLGIVPDGVSRVRVQLADGSVRTVHVLDNVYAARFATATQSVSYASPQGPVTLPAASR